MMNTIDRLMLRLIATVFKALHQDTNKKEYLGKKRHVILNMQRCK